MAIDESLFPLSPAETKIVTEQLQKTAALPATPDGILAIIEDSTDKIWRLSEKFFLATCEHATRVRFNWSISVMYKY
jgi:hypothetical protein